MLACGLQCRSQYAVVIAAKKGIRKLTKPMASEGLQCFRSTSGSISAPARNVSRMLPKPARKLIQGVVSNLADVPINDPTRGMTSPAAAPTRISMSATQMAVRIEIMLANSARPTHKAAINQGDSSIPILLPDETGRSHQPCRRLSGGLNPHQ